MLNCIYRKYLEKKYFRNFLSKETNMELFDGLNNLLNFPLTESLMILGNGSSLNEVINSFDTSFSYMVVNAHVLHESYIKIKPMHYVLADPLFFSSQKGKDILLKINNDTRWNMNIYVPFIHNKDKNVEKIIDNPRIHIIPYNINEYYHKGKNCNYCYEHNLAIPSVENVMVAAIYIAMCIGYKKIELFGVEHSWTKSLYVNSNNEVCLHDDHFYDKSNIKDRKFDKKIYEMLQSYARMFESYWELNKIAEMKFVEIINKTPDSFIDAFKRE